MPLNTRLLAVAFAVTGLVWHTPLALSNLRRMR